MRKLLVVLISVVFMVGFSIPALSQPPGPPNISDTWTIDGRAGVKTYYTDQDEERANYPGGETDLSWIGKSARIRVQYKTDDFKGFIELGEATGTETMIFKHYYGEVNMGSWSLLVGQYDPLSFNPADAPSDQVTNPVGVAVGHERGPQIRGRFPMGAMTLSVALLTTEIRASGISDEETSLPAVEVKADFVTGGIPWAVWGGYQTYDMIDGSTGTEYTESLDSYVIAAVARPSFGPVRMNASFFMEQNNYQSLPPFSYPAINPSWAGGTSPVDETEAWGLHASVGYVFNPMFTVWTGFGLASAETDSGDEQETMCYWINMPIQMTQNLKIIPYFSYYDAGDNVVAGVDLGDRGTETVIGALWEVTF